MSTSVELQRDFFNWMPVLIGLSIVVAMPLFLILWRLWQIIRLKIFKKTKTELQGDNTNQADRNDTATLKKVYQKQLRELKKQVEINKITERMAFQRLSVLVRAFVSDYTGEDITTKTLADLKRIDRPGFALLIERIERYYEPEFGTDSAVNLSEELEEAKRFIKQWK